MPQEIERKFLVRGDFKAYACQSFRIVQGYLSSVPERTVRIRVKGEQGYLTVKGKSDVHGVTRYEWEKEIAREDAEELLKLCEPGVVDKIRYLVKVGGHIFSAEAFLGFPTPLSTVALSQWRGAQPTFSFKEGMANGLDSPSPASAKFTSSGW